jgi:chromosome segregation ATPase
VQEAQAAIQRHLRSLKPQVTDAETLAATSVPPRDTVQMHRDARRHLDQRLNTCSERIRTAEQDLAKQQKAHKRLTHDEDAACRRAPSISGRSWI